MMISCSGHLISNFPEQRFHRIRIFKKGIFTEYLPSNFNLDIGDFNIYGGGASYKDIIEPLDLIIE